MKIINHAYYFQGCPSFRKRRPSLAPLLEATGATTTITATTQSGISNHINKTKDHKNNNNNERTGSSNMKFRSPIVAATTPTLLSPTFKTTTPVGIMQGEEYESDDSLVVQNFQMLT